MLKTPTCSACQMAMQSLGTRALRTGGATGVAGMFLGGLNQLGEGRLPVALFVCPECRRLEWYLPD